MMALVRPKEMFSLRDKERWLVDGFFFISNKVSSSGLDILRLPSVVLLQDTDSI